MRSSGTLATILSLGLFSTSTSRAEPIRDAERDDRYDFWVHSETHAELFQRALLPGPNGALVSRTTALPLNQYLRLRVQDLDVPWQNDGLDVEFAAWGQLWLGERDTERSFDGDVQTANVRFRKGPFVLRLGRQHVAGGAARYARFDGVEAEVDLGVGFELQAYGGFSVLPRWDARPGYAYLGSAADSQLRAPNAQPEPDRASYWQSGGRLAWANATGRAGVSFHEQRQQGGLSRRNLGLDAQASIGEASLGGSAIAELDARRLADARLWVDARLWRLFDGSIEYLHAEPALFLSRQSVLSVFSTDGYDEAGASLAAPVAPRLAFEAGAWAQIYEGHRTGGRGELTARMLADRSRTTLVRVTYARVQAPENGYHSVRSSLARKFLPRLTGTLEAYGYLYDEPIRGYRTSTVYSTTLGFRPNQVLGIVWGTSLSRSAYARLDAQTQLHLTCDFDFTNRAGLR
jgi:hypothetical protein